MILADLGADVIRVERPGGQALAGGATMVLNRGRPSVALDLKNPEAARVVLDLVRDADVLVEGLRPGVTERLGIGPDDCLAVNERLVYGRMTGWGQDGPLATAAGHDMNYIAITGALFGLGPGQGPAALPVQPGGRLRRRLHLPRDRRPRRTARGQGLRAGSGGGRRDRRRHRPPQRDDVGLPGQRRLPRGAGGEPARRRRAVLRRLRHQRRPRTSVSARWSRSSSRPWSPRSASRTPAPARPTSTATTRCGRSSPRCSPPARWPSGWRSSRAPTRAWPAS